MMTDSTDLCPICGEGRLHPKIEKNPVEYKGETTDQQRQAARENLSLIESDRLYRLARIEAHATEVFEDEETAADWLKQPNRALGEKPIDLLDTDAGTDRVDRLLTRIEYGVYS